MPVKKIAAALAWGVFAAFLLGRSTRATPIPADSICSFATTFIPTAGLDIRKRGARYRVFTSGPINKPKNFFRTQIFGLDLTEGDRIALSFGGVRLGDITQGSGLTLDRRLRARGTLGPSPNFFEFAKAVYNPKKRRLTVLARRGVSETGDIPFQLSGITPAATEIKIFVDCAPPDGIIDVSGAIPVTFRVRSRTRNSGTFIERGTSQ